MACCITVPTSLMSARGYHYPGDEVLKRFSQLLQNVFDRSRQHSPIGAGSGRGCTVGRCYRRSHEQDDHGGEQDGGHSGFGSHCAALLIDRSLSRVGHAVLWATHRVFIRASATAAIRKRAMDHQLFSQQRVAVRGEPRVCSSCPYPCGQIWVLSIYFG